MGYRAFVKLHPRGAGSESAHKIGVYRPGERCKLYIFFKFNFDGFSVPDFLAVLPNRTIG